MTLRECIAKYGRPLQRSGWRLIHAIQATQTDARKLYGISPETFHMWNTALQADVKPMTWEDLVRGLEAASK